MLAGSCKGGTDRFEGFPETIDEYEFASLFGFEPLQGFQQLGMDWDRLRLLVLRKAGFNRQLPSLQSRLPRAPPPPPNSPPKRIKGQIYFSSRLNLPRK
jgi:hypothetical protein